MDITLGLDFGTHQSKLCMSYRPANEIIHEFIEFDTPDGGKTTLFPSVIQINNDGTIGIGFVDQSRCLISASPKPKEPVYPVEPSKLLPKKPKLSYPTEPKAVALDWKDKLFAIKNGNGIDKNQITHKKWEEECKTIYNVWEKENNQWRQDCERILNLHKIWETQVNEITRHYEEEIRIWESNPGIPQYYRYFKLASFSSVYLWNSNNYVSPDILSIWYLTYLMLITKIHVEKNLNEVFEESVSIQMGIPTSTNEILSKQISDHAFKLLVAARELMEMFDKPEDMLCINYKDLIEITRIPTSKVRLKGEEFGFVVLPEAFAGLQSLTNRKRLSRGKMHLLVDIGGGTTDIAFFTITEDLKPNIHIVKSFHKGLNYVFEEFCKSHRKLSVMEAQDLFFCNQKEFSNAISTYTSELQNQLSAMLNVVKQEFYARVGIYGKTEDDLVAAINGCPIVYCGGGSMYDKMRVSAKYFTDIRRVDKNTLNIPNLRNRDIDESLFPILAISYGLSVPQVNEPEMVPLSVLFEHIGENVCKGQSSSSSQSRDYGVDDD